MALSSASSLIFLSLFVIVLFGGSSITLWVAEKQRMLNVFAAECSVFHEEVIHCPNVLETLIPSHGSGQYRTNCFRPIWNVTFTLSDDHQHQHHSANSTGPRTPQEGVILGGEVDSQEEARLVLARYPLSLNGTDYLCFFFAGANSGPRGNSAADHELLWTEPSSEMKFFIMVIVSLAGGGTCFLIGLCALIAKERRKFSAVQRPKFEVIN